MSRKRKVDADGRLFHERWEGEYMFVLQREKTVCLLCSEVVSVIKEYNLRRHYETKHGAKYAKVSLQEKQAIVRVKRQPAIATEFVLKSHSQKRCGCES